MLIVVLARLWCCLMQWLWHLCDLSDFGSKDSLCLCKCWKLLFHFFGPDCQLYNLVIYDTTGWILLTFPSPDFFLPAPPQAKYFVFFQWSILTAIEWFVMNWYRQPLTRQWLIMILVIPYFFFCHQQIKVFMYQVKYFIIHKLNWYILCTHSWSPHHVSQWLCWPLF